MLKIKLNDETQVINTDNLNYQLQELRNNKKPTWVTLGYYPSLKSALKAYVLDHRNQNIESVNNYLTMIDDKLVEVKEVLDK